MLTGSFLDSTSPLLAIAACTALGEIGRNGPLPIHSEGSGFTKLHLVESLLNRIPSSKETNKASLFLFSFPFLLEFCLSIHRYVNEQNQILMRIHGIAAGRSTC
jgi:hypothetical protein